LIGGKVLNQQLVKSSRKELETKMATVFGGKIRGLSNELQQMLLDDMVTAFESRFAVMSRAQLKKA
jgi:hypothetical protein